MKKQVKPTVGITVKYHVGSVKTPQNTVKMERQTTPVNIPSSSNQCTSQTKAGSRCKKRTKSANGKCSGHGG
ncbi:MAG: hypothetical protein V4565_14560 [Bacteroidota bacterium]